MSDDSVKKPGTITNFTDEMRGEVLKSMLDPLYFIQNHVMIQHPLKGSVPFVTYPYQERLIKAFHNNRFAIALTARQMGKALSLDTPIMTPTGFVPMGELRVGDTIYGADGLPTKISFITETMENRECYLIEFSHGDSVIADAEHLWNVRLPTRKGPVETVTTVEMLDLKNRYSAVGQSISIEMTQPLEIDHKELMVDPYLVGVYLGDGAASDARITCHVEDYPHYRDVAIAAGHEVSDFRPDRRRPTTGGFAITGLRAALSQIGVLGDKHIPQSYLLGSLDQRLALLQGLMDTDGAVEKNGVCRFYQSNERLIDDVRVLLSSLGIKSTKRVKKTTHGKCFILTFASTQTVCRLPRKLERLANLKDHPKNHRIYIRSIEPVESVPVRCLQVDNEDHLFLCGKTMVPTHNTTCASAYLLHRALFNPDSTILIVGNVLQSAQEILERIQYAYENLPDYLKCGAPIYNKRSMSFDNGSRIVCRATTPSAGRGLSISLLYCDEFAFVNPRQSAEFWKAIYPTLSTGGSCIITSTPKTDTDQFAQLWRQACNNKDDNGNEVDHGRGTNGFYPVKVIWSEHPERNESWAQEQREILGEAGFRQEMCCVIGDTKVQITDPEIPNATFRIGHSREMTMDELYGLLKLHVDLNEPTPYQPSSQGHGETGLGHTSAVNP